MRILSLLAILLGTLAFAEVDSQNPNLMSSEFKDKEGVFINARVGISFSEASNYGSDGRAPFLGGLGVDYFFHPVVGAFADLQYTSRGYKISSQSSTASFIDIPFGLAFNHGTIFSKYARSNTRLGGYYAIPAGDYSGNLALNFSNKPKGFFGIYLDNESLFNLTEHFALGYTLWVKIGLGSAIDASIESKFTEIGIGFIASFF